MSLVINAVRSNIHTFKEVEFTPGFNIILADTTDHSHQKDSRNGLGKSTLIEIIHFCLGAKIVKGKGLGHEALNGWSFELEITINQENILSIEVYQEPPILLMSMEILMIGQSNQKAKMVTL